MRKSAQTVIRPDAYYTIAAAKPTRTQTEKKTSGKAARRTSKNK